MQWFGHLEAVEESAWSCKCRIFKASGSFHRRRPRKTWKIIRSDLKEIKVSKNLDKNRNAWKSH